MKVPINKIKPNPFQERKNFKEGTGTLEVSMKKYGFLGSLVAREKKGIYELAFGERRLIAARKAGIKEIDLDVQELNDEKMMVLTTVENVQREDVAPLDRAAHLAMVQKKMGWSDKELAINLGMSIATVHDYLSADSAPIDTKKMIRSGEIGWTTALEAERVGGHELVRTVASEKLTKDDIREIKDAIRVAPNLKKELVSREMHPSELVRQRLEHSKESPEDQAKHIRTSMEKCGLEVQHLAKIFHRLQPLTQHMLSLTYGAHREMVEAFWRDVGMQQIIDKGVPKA